MRLTKVVVLLLLFRVSRVLSEDDSQCLKQFQQSVKDDPDGFMSNWNFENTSQGSVCSFNGVNCWKEQESRVLSLKLAGAGLSGPFPLGLNNCQALTGLDLSDNSFYGSIPRDICEQQLEYLTTLDLSKNKFSGSIPDNLGSCQYLNSLNMRQNKLTGAIPWEIGVLPRLSNLDLSSNSLVGQIPSSFTNRTAIKQSSFPASAFENNPGLCGAPLSTTSCGSSDVLLRIVIPVAGFGVFAIVFAFTIWWVFCRARSKDRVKSRLMVELAE